MPHLFAVIVEHLPENCPLAQATPDAALALADNLDQAQAHGVFSMKLHHGVALVSAEEETGIANTFARVLPRHQSPVVIEVTGDTWLQDLSDHPAGLDGDEELRLQLLDHVAKRFTGFDLRATRQQGLPTNSLVGLPQYLREHAPQA